MKEVDLSNIEEVKNELRENSVFNEKGREFSNELTLLKDKLIADDVVNQCAHAYIENEKYVKEWYANGRNMFAFYEDIEALIANEFYMMAIYELIEQRLDDSRSFTQVNFDDGTKGAYPTRTQAESACFEYLFINKNLYIDYVKENKEALWERFMTNEDYDSRGGIVSFIASHEIQSSYWLDREEKHCYDEI